MCMTQKHIYIYIYKITTVVPLTSCINYFHTWIVAYFSYIPPKKVNDKNNILNNHKLIR